uniref:TPD52 like 1 n=1 Tax=Terrapene triunguis TaxID=2587831 RepID=A0A674HX43_9SAUR
MYCKSFIDCYFLIFKGLLETQPLHETDEEMVTDIDFTSMISEEEREELKIELAKLLNFLTLPVKTCPKAQRAFRLPTTTESNFSGSWMYYKKTHETLSHAGQKATAAISNVGTAIGKKFGDMSYSIRHSISMPAMRNSPTFKSFEEKVETTVTSLKTKVGGTSPSGGSFEEVLSSTAHASAQGSITGTPLPENEEELQC